MFHSARLSKSFQISLLQLTTQATPAVSGSPCFASEFALYFAVFRWFASPSHPLTAVTFLHYQHLELKLNWPESAYLSMPGSFHCHSLAVLVGVLSFQCHYSVPCFGVLTPAVTCLIHQGARCSWTRLLILLVAYQGPRVPDLLCHIGLGVPCFWQALCQAELVVSQFHPLTLSPALPLPEISTRIPSASYPAMPKITVPSKPFQFRDSILPCLIVSGCCLCHPPLSQAFSIPSKPPLV